MFRRKLVEINKGVYVNKDLERKVEKLRDWTMERKDKGFSG